MSQENEELRGKVEDALSALVQAEYGDHAVTGAWIVCAEIMIPGEEDMTVFMHEGGGSMLARRGLIESTRDQLAASWTGDSDD